MLLLSEYTFWMLLLSEDTLWLLQREDIHLLLTEAALRNFGDCQYLQQNKTLNIFHPLAFEYQVRAQLFASP